MTAQQERKHLLVQAACAKYDEVYINKWLADIGEVIRAVREQYATINTMTMKMSDKSIVLKAGLYIDKTTIMYADYGDRDRIQRTVPTTIRSIEDAMRWHKVCGEVETRLGEWLEVLKNRAMTREEFVNRNG